jgi:hypothetical protein
MKKYYNDSDEEMDAAFEEFSKLGTRFLVAGRVPTKESPFLSLQNVTFPDGFKYQHLFIELPAHVFRADISSTAIRSGEVATGL